MLANPASAPEIPTPPAGATSSDRFGALGLSDRLKANVAALGFTDPTPIQERTIPEVLRGKSVLALSATGSGKTAAYALPILKLLEDFPPEQGAAPVVGIFVPTRELALQVDLQLSQLGKGSGLSSVVLYGQTSKGSQIRELQRGPSIVIGCPGRVLDLADEGLLNLRNLQFLVLDEVDRMIDGDFRKDFERIQRHCPPSDCRQTLLFSASMTPEIKGYAKGLLFDPIIIDVGHEAPLKEIQHLGISVPNDGQKSQVLNGILQRAAGTQVIVFVRTRECADRVAAELQQNRTNARSVHAGLNQWEREQIGDQFRQKRLDVVVATDAYARGVDFDVRLVVNYELGQDRDSYRHRAGRTGRAGRQGVVVNLIGPIDRFRMAESERSLGARILVLRDTESFFARLGELLSCRASISDSSLPAIAPPPVTPRASSSEGVFLGKEAYRFSNPELLTIACASNGATLRADGLPSSGYLRFLGEALFDFTVASTIAYQSRWTCSEHQLEVGIAAARSAKSFAGVSPGTSMENIAAILGAILFDAQNAGPAQRAVSHFIPADSLQSNIERTRSGPRNAADFLNAETVQALEDAISYQFKNKRTLADACGVSSQGEIIIEPRDHLVARGKLALTFAIRGAEGFDRSRSYDDLIAEFGSRTLNMRITNSPGWQAFETGVAGHHGLPESPTTDQVFSLYCAILGAVTNDSHLDNAVDVVRGFLRERPAVTKRSPPVVVESAELAALNDWFKQRDLEAAVRTSPMQDGAVDVDLRFRLSLPDGNPRDSRDPEKAALRMFYEKLSRVFPEELGRLPGENAATSVGKTAHEPPAPIPDPKVTRDAPVSAVNEPRANVTEGPDYIAAITTECATRGLKQFKLSAKPVAGDGATRYRAQVSWKKQPALSATGPDEQSALQAAAKLALEALEG